MTSATAARQQSSLGMLISPHADHPGIATSNMDTEVTEIACNRLEKNVNLLWVQLLDIDETGHSHGPYGPESQEAAEGADQNLNKILSTARIKGYSVMVLADHGQHISPTNPDKGTHGTDMPEDLYVPLLWANNHEI